MKFNFCEITINLRNYFIGFSDLFDLITENNIRLVTVRGSSYTLKIDFIMYFYMELLILSLISVKRGQLHNWLISFDASSFDIRFFLRECAHFLECSSYSPNFMKTFFFTKKDNLVWCGYLTTVVEAHASMMYIDKDVNAWISFLVDRKVQFSSIPYCYFTPYPFVI